tara:strand:+ start:281 stop:499 length:219 start_codon:yes stop_codon:yes gene_type:complete
MFAQRPQSVPDKNNIKVGESKVSKIIRKLLGRKKNLFLIFELNDSSANGKNPINKIKEYLKITSIDMSVKTD